MVKFSKLIAIGGSFLLFSACASITPEECALADWEQYGYNDGLRGDEMRSAQSGRDRACVKQGIVPDRIAYKKGYERGVARFCTPRNGYEFGKAGRAYTGLCRDHEEAAFLVEYDLGYELYEFTSAVTRAERRLANAQSRYDQAERKLTKLRTDMVHYTANGEAELLAETLPEYQRVTDLRSAAEVDIRLAEEDVIDARHALDEYRYAERHDLPVRVQASSY